jgi:hypothetical protein
MTTPTTAPNRSVRVAGIYATRWRYRPVKPEPAETHPVDHNTFTGTRFEDFAEAFKDQLNRLPKLIAGERSVLVRFATEFPGVKIERAQAYLFTLPSDQVVAALLLDCVCPTSVVADPAPLDRMLDAFTEERFLVDGAPLPRFLIDIAPEADLENLTEPYKEVEPEESRWRRALVRLHLRRPTPTERIKQPLHGDLPERHEVVFLSDPAPLDAALQENLLYRAKARYQKEFSRQRPVSELTEEGGSKLGVVTTRSSLVQGHDPLVETSILLSTVQAVGTLARFRNIWDRAYELVQDFRNTKLKNTSGTQQRDDLENLVDELGNLEFDLTFSVEFPLMRVETYHSALSETLDLPEQAKRMSAMFAQIGGSVKSEITAIDIRDNRENELRMRRNMVASQWFAAIGVPITALLAFFGVNALEVSSDHSLFDWDAYRYAYIGAVLLGFLPATVLWISKRWARRKLARDHRLGPRP